MAQFGSGRSVIAQNQSAVSDSNGNLIVSPDNAAGASPLGVAALNQVSIGVPNGTFNILPSDPVGAINTSNPLPYWDFIADEGFSAAMGYDTDTQTNSVEIDPTAVGTAPGTAILRTRIPITNDEGLSVRQYVSSSLVQQIKTGTGSRWTATLTSQYYDTTGAAIGTPYIIGTFLERDIVTTNLASYTNASGPIPTTAAELELSYTLAVGTALPTYLLKIKSVMVATEYGAIGGGGAGTTIIDSFTSSGTWTRPAGVEYVTVVALAAGQGGQSGGCVTGRAILPPVFTANGGAGGASGYWAIVKDVYVGDKATVSVGIGAGGSGGTAFAFTKGTGSTTTITQTNGANGSSGGDVTFGSLLVVPGARTAPTGYFGIDSAAGTTGGTQGPGATGGAGGSGATHLIGGTYVGAPYTTFVTSGTAGLAGTANGGSRGSAGAASASAGLLGGGGGGGGGSAAATALGGNGGAAGPTAGGGGGAVAMYWPLTSNATGTAGNGGNAGANTGGGGGGGGAVVTATAGTTSGNASTNYSNSTITISSGAGGNGGSGLLKVIYVG